MERPQQDNSTGSRQRPGIISSEYVQHGLESVLFLHGTIGFWPKIYFYAVIGYCPWDLRTSFGPRTGFEETQSGSIGGCTPEYQTQLEMGIAPDGLIKQTTVKDTYTAGSWDCERTIIFNV